jgi:hypothetical protein
LLTPTPRYASSVNSIHDNHSKLSASGEVQPVNSRGSVGYLFLEEKLVRTKLLCPSILAIELCAGFSNRPTSSPSSTPIYEDANDLKHHLSVTEPHEVPEEYQNCYDQNKTILLLALVLLLLKFTSLLTVLQLSFQ